MSRYESAMVMYDQPWRHYHNHNHIKSVDQYAYEISRALGCANIYNFPNFIAAIDLHDVVYNVGYTGSEEASANIARSYGYQEAAGYILDTINHRPEHGKHKWFSEILIDADLAGLAWQYEINRLLLRHEVMSYIDQNTSENETLWVEDIWINGRIKFLEGFLARPQIFFTEYMKQFEDTAKENMQNELDGLNDKSQ